MKLAPIDPVHGRLASSRRSLARACDALALASLVVLAIIAVFTFRDYGLGWDDYSHSQMGDLLLALFGSGFRDQRAFSFVNLYMYGSGFDIVAALISKLLAFDIFPTRRLLGALVGIAALALTWRIARRLGGAAAGLLAVLLLATCPVFYGHMFINAKDAPFAAAMAMLLLGLLRVVDEYPRPSPATVMLFGVGLGLTLGTRIMGVIAALYAVAPLALLLLDDARSVGLRAALGRALVTLLELLPGLVVAYLVMGLVWPWSVAEPLNPLRAAEYFSHFFEKPWRELFGGELIPVPDMPWTYLPTLFALKLPEVLVVLAAAGVVLALARAAIPGRPARERAAFALIVGAAILPIALALITRPALYNGIRHFLFVLPPLAVLGGVAASALLERLARLNRAALAVGAALLLVGLLSPVVEIVRLHPYEYTHFNHVAGGVRGANGRYMLDYWALALKQAAQQLRARLAETKQSPPAGRRWKIAVCGPHPPAQVALGPDFETTWESRGADLALVLGTFYCRLPDAPVLANVEREGVMYARAYDLRNATLPNLLNFPPP